MTAEQKQELDNATRIAKKNNHKVYTGTAWTGQEVYLVKSHSDKNHFHVLSVDGSRILCDCYQYRTVGKICSHAAAVRQFLIERKEAAQPEITQESLAAALKTISPDTELATFQGNGQESRNGTAIIAVERAIRKTMGREVTAGMSHLTTEDYQMHEMPRWYRQMMTDAAWTIGHSIKVGHLLYSITPKEQPMQETIITCKRCPRRCNGQTGLCYQCEQQQRKAESVKRTCAYCGLLFTADVDNDDCLKCPYCLFKQRANNRETAPLYRSNADFSIFKTA